jgi:hypothetical protein
MAKLQIGEKVQIISAIPGFHLQEGIVASITEPFVVGERAKEEALLELRLYVVRLDDGRHFRFRGKELLHRDQTIAANRETSPAHQNL